MIIVCNLPGFIAPNSYIRARFEIAAFRAQITQNKTIIPSRKRIAIDIMNAARCLEETEILNTINIHIYKAPMF